VAHHTLQAGAPNLPLGPGIKLVLEAVNPTTDAAVAGVVVTRWTIYGDDESAGPPLDEGPYEPFEIPQSG